MIKKNYLTASVLLLSTFLSAQAYSFCGFYVAKADTNLYNKASQVILVRDENKTVLSMMNDFKGDLKDFAMVIPVPTVLKKEQINAGNRKMFSRIDGFTAPRLVEYFDPDPCERPVFAMESVMRGQVKMMKTGSTGVPKKSAKSLGVKIEAEYTVGEYDIVLLSAKQSNGLETWLHQENYKIPKGASVVLKPYIKQKMNFFVAKVNMKEQAKTGLTYLRPLQFAFESEKFMLPIRLGMLNSEGEQELFIYVLTKNGRVETTNYLNVKLPTGMEIPPYIKNDFSNFYTSMFNTQVKKEKGKAVFTEYFWDMGWCDPCAADPLSQEELKELGVFWLKPKADYRAVNKPASRFRRPTPRPGGGAQPVKVTRLHVKYKKKNFPADLMFQETKDKQNFQARYVLRHAWKGDKNKCTMSKDYYKTLPARFEREAQALARLTDWDINDIRKKLDLKAQPKKDKKKNWWEDLWN